VHCYATDREVVRFMQWGPNDEEATRAYIQRKLVQQSSNPRFGYDLAVTIKTDHQLIGGCSINISNSESCQAWIGYIFNRNYWGRGYATEAALAIIAFGFGQLGLHRIFATCDFDNIASAHILEKIGMRREGLRREDEWLRGEWRDSYLYAILEQEWRSSKMVS
jgi:RimJ/RimL family protein N-acetyltransferase